MIKNSLKVKKIALVLSVVALLLTGSPVSANVYSDRDAVNKQLEQQRAALNQVRGQVNTLQGQLAALDESINTLNARITQNSREIAAVEKEIAKQEAELAIRKEQSNELVRSVYQQSQVSSLEMLVGSNSLSDFIDKSQYLDSAREKVTEIADQISALKDELAKQKTALEANRRELDANRQAINVERAKQSELLATTKGQESEFQAQVEKTKQQKAALESQIAALSRSTRISGAKASGSVKRGQVIGYEGTTGNSTGCHLHFTVYSGGKEVNPSLLISSGEIGKPLDYGPGNITQGFGAANWSNPWYNFHNGLDIATGCGRPIYAAADGDIVKNVSNDGSGYGHYIVINHNNGLVSLYAHMQ